MSVCFSLPHTQGQMCNSLWKWTLPRWPDGVALGGTWAPAVFWESSWRVSAEDRTSRTVPLVRKSCCTDKDPTETPNWERLRRVTMVRSATVGVSTTQPYTQGSGNIEQEGAERARGPGCLLLGSVSQVRQESCTHEILPIWLLR